MRDHSVVVDESSTPRGIEFAETFNVSVAFLDRHLEEGRGDKPLLVTRGACWTIAAIADRVSRTANAFRALGIGRGDRVMLFCKDGPGFHDGFLGAARIGAVAIPVNYFLRAADYAYMLRDSGASAVLAHADMFGEVEPGAGRGGGGGAAPHLRRWRGAGLALARGAARRRRSLVRARADDARHRLLLALFLGLDRRSQGVGPSAQGPGLHLRPLRRGGGRDYGGRHPVLAAQDGSSPTGSANSVSFPFWTGATAIYLEGRPTAENTLEAIAEFRPSVYFGVPTLYAMQLAAMEAGHAADLSSLRWAASGGEALPASVFEDWKSRSGVEIVESIGSSEALHFYTANPPGGVRAGSLGTIVPGYEGRIVGETGEDLPDGEPGELVIRGESVAAYYWNKPERTARGMRDGGWFHTGDTCYRDGDGYYYFCGRDDDMLKVGGIWVAPFEVESALAAHPGVLEAAVVGAADEHGLTKPKAFVALKEPGGAGPGLEAELVAFVRDRLAPFKYPRWIEFVDELPKTASGKIQRFRLRGA